MGNHKEVEGFHRGNVSRVIYQDKRKEALHLSSQLFYIFYILHIFGCKRLKIAHWNKGGAQIS